VFCDVLKIINISWPVQNTRARPIQQSFPCVFMALDAQLADAQSVPEGVTVSSGPVTNLLYCRTWQVKAARTLAQLKQQQ